MRRRLMLSSADPWDYEWNPSMGLLSQNGFSTTISGTASERMGTDSVLLFSAGNGNYISLKNPERFNKSMGVLECVVNLTGFLSAYPNCRVCFGNGTYGIQLSIGARNSICLMDSINSNSYTIIASFQTNTDYKIKLVLDASIASVYINDQLIRSNIPVSDTLFPYSKNTSIWSHAQNADTIVKSVRLKLGRV